MMMKKKIRKNKNKSISTSLNILKGTLTTNIEMEFIWAVMEFKPN